MTTLVIDCENQAVYADSCMTSQKSILQDKNLVGELFTKVEHWHPFMVVRRIRSKVTHKGEVVIVGTGCSELVTRFSSTYASEIPCGIESGEDATIYVVEKRVEGLVIDKYSVTEVRSKWYLKPTRVWQIESYVRTQGYVTDGSGGSFAMGALEAGCTPNEAIKVASRLDPYTNSYVDEVILRCDVGGED